VECDDPSCKLHSYSKKYLLFKQEAYRHVRQNIYWKKLLTSSLLFISSERVFLECTLILYSVTLKTQKISRSLFITIPFCKSKASYWSQF